MMYRTTMARAVGAVLAVGLVLGFAAGCSDDDDGPACGDGILQGNEECDGQNLGLATCASEGYRGGTLACTSLCAFDYTGCDPYPECNNNGVMEADEECDGTDFGTTTCQTEGFDGGDLSCTNMCTVVDTACCTSGCTTQGAQRCNSAYTDVETCAVGSNGCLDWAETADCDGNSQVCDDSGSGAACVDSCTSECTTEGEEVCQGTLLRTCTLRPNGCMTWEDTDCAPGTCGGTPPACQVANGTCTNPFGITLADIGGGVHEGTASGNTDTGSTANQVPQGDCDGETSGAAHDLIYQFTLTEAMDATILLEGDYDRVLRLLGAPCDLGAEIPEPGADNGCADVYPGDEELRYAGLEAGTYYVVVDGWSSSDVGNFTLTVTAMATRCGNGSIEYPEQCDDNDRDNNDGCDSHCSIEDGYYCIGEPSACSLPVSPLDPGDLVVTEIMVDPLAVDDATGEWFEVHNPTATTFFNLFGMVVRDDDTDSFTIDSTVIVWPGQTVLLADELVPYDSGLGVLPHFDYDGMRLDNVTDEIELVMDGTVIDRVAWDGTFPVVEGAAMALDPDHYSAVDNNLAANWCDSTAAGIAYGMGDFGTPNAQNPPCAGTQTELLDEGFGIWSPTGWTITDGGDTNDTWEQCNQVGCAYGVFDIRVGAFALVDNLAAGSVTMEESLQTPALDCSSYDNVVLVFDHFLGIDTFQNAYGLIYVTTDQGQTWYLMDMFYWTSNLEGTTPVIDISSVAAGESSVNIEFYYLAMGDLFWMIDNVRVYAW